MAFYFVFVLYKTIVKIGGNTKYKHGKIDKIIVKR